MSQKTQDKIIHPAAKDIQYVADINRETVCYTKRLNILSGRVNISLRLKEIGPFRAGSKLRRGAKIVLALWGCLVLASPPLLEAANITNQGSVMSKTCPLGSAEAEEILQLGRKYSAGEGGYPRDRKKAQELFLQAWEMGNSKAPLALGQMYQYWFSLNMTERNRFKLMVQAYEASAKRGCPDAYVPLAEAYENGWGVSKSRKKAFDLRRKAAELGSPKGLELYAAELAYDKRAPGFVISFDSKSLADAKKMLYRSLELGNGDAGVLLYKIYKREKIAKV